MIESNELSNLLEKASNFLVSSRSLLGSTSMADIEVKQYELVEMASALESIVNDYENQMENLRKEGRRISNEIGELKQGQRPFSHCQKDLLSLSRRLKSAYFNLRDQKKDYNVK